MLRTRVLTAVLLLPAVLGTLFWLPTGAFTALVLLFAGAAAWEWSLLARVDAVPLRAAFTAMVMALCVLTLNVPAATTTWLLGAMLWWVLSLSVLAEARLPAVRRGFARPVTQVAGALVVLPGAAAALGRLFDGGSEPWRVVALLVLVWAADIGAYFAGRAFGRHPLAPQISPRKTWEGAAGGAAAALVVGLPLTAAAFDWSALRAGFVVAVAIVAAIVGDLIESAQKRHASLKDSGSLLPGHGGVLDRVDSLLATAPLLAVASWPGH